MRLTATTKWPPFDQLEDTVFIEMAQMRSRDSPDRVRMTYPLEKE